MCRNRLIHLALLVLILFTAGCRQSDNTGKLEGTSWTSDPSTLKGQYLSPGALGLDFRADGTMVYRARGQTFTGRYSLGSGPLVTFFLDEALGESKVHTESIVIIGDSLTMTDGDGTEIKFRKQKPSAPPKSTEKKKSEKSKKPAEK